MTVIEPMSVRPSNESGGNLPPLMEDSLKSRTIPPSVIAGAPSQTSIRAILAKALLTARRVVHSLTLRLAVLVLIFMALPVFLYGQFEQADSRSRDFVAHSIRYGSWMIAQALLPVS